MRYYLLNCQSYDAVLYQMSVRRNNGSPNKGKILHVPSTFQRAIAHLKARKKLNFIVIVADFQIAKQAVSYTHLTLPTSDLV